MAKANDGKQQKGPVSLKGLQSLERLRERVEVAARELERLREENLALSRRLQELNARSPVTLEEDLPLVLDEDPEALRRKVTGFIEALDRYLEQEPESG